MKLYILAFLVLTAAVTVAGNERIIVVPRVKELIKKNAHFHKRDNEGCIAIKCGKLDESCDDLTICPVGAVCIGGTCHEPVIGDSCSQDEDCGLKLECNQGKCAKSSDDTIHIHPNKAVNRTNIAKKRSECTSVDDCKQ